MEFFFFFLSFAQLNFMGLVALVGEGGSTEFNMIPVFIFNKHKCKQIPCVAIVYLGCITISHNVWDTIK